MLDFFCADLGSCLVCFAFFNCAACFRDVSLRRCSPCCCVAGVPSSTWEMLQYRARRRCSGGTERRGHADQSRLQPRRRCFAVVYLMRSRISKEVVDVGVLGFVSAPGQFRPMCVDGLQVLFWRRLFFWGARAAIWTFLCILACDCSTYWNNAFFRPRSLSPPCSSFLPSFSPLLRCFSLLNSFS